MLEEFSGNGEGQQLLRDIVKQDPEVVKNIIGQRYVTKPSEIHNPNELMREYLQESSNLNKLIGQKESALKDFAKQQNITLEQKMKAEKELANMKAGKTRQKNILKYGAMGAGAYGAYKWLPKLYNEITGGNQ